MNNLTYADGTLIIASNDIELEHIMNGLNTESKEYGLLFNKNETKVMVIDRTPINIKKIGGFEVVAEFIYFESLITNRERDKEIKRIIHKALNTGTSLAKIW